MTGILIRGGNLGYTDTEHTDTRGKCSVMTDREWDDGSTHQRTPRISSNHQKLERHLRTLPQCLQWEYGSADTSILDFQPHNFKRINACCFKPPNLWCFMTRAQKSNPMSWKFVETYKVTLKFIWKLKEPRIATTILKKNNKVEGLTKPTLVSRQHKETVIKIVWSWHKGR